MMKCGLLQMTCKNIAQRCFLDSLEVTVIPNLDLIHNETLSMIKEINDMYLKKIPDARLINKRYESFKKRSYDT